MSAETDLINSLRQSLLEANQAQATLASKLSDMTAAFTVYDAGQQPPPQNGPYTLGVLGDSRMAVDWNAILGRTDILVLAVPGQRISDWKANWQTNCQTMAATGIKKWICEWGKNDVDAGRAVADIGHDFQDVVTLIGAYCNGSRVGVLGPLPVTASSPNAAMINSQLNQLGGVLYNPYLPAASPVGIWYQGFAPPGLPSLVNGSGQLLDSYTSDGMAHLNTAGNAIRAQSIVVLEGMIPSA